MDEKRLRFIDAEWAQDITFQDVILGGIGGIGSWLALLLSRVNVRSLLIFEDDIVNFHNIGGQLYGIDDVGKSKYDSLIKTILNFSAPVETSIFPGRRLEKYMLKDASNTLKVLNPSIVFSNLLPGNILVSTVAEKFNIVLIKLSYLLFPTSSIPYNCPPIL